MPTFSSICRAAAKAAVLFLAVSPTDGGAMTCREDAWTPEHSQHIAEATAWPAPDEIIVKLREQGDDAVPTLSFRDADMLGLQETPDIGPGGELTYRLSFDVLFSSSDPGSLESEIRSVIEALQARSDVVFAKAHWSTLPVRYSEACAPTLR